ALLLRVGAVVDQRRTGQPEPDRDVDHVGRSGREALLVEDELLERRERLAAVLLGPCEPCPPPVVELPLPPPGERDLLGGSLGLRRARTRPAVGKVGAKPFPHARAEGLLGRGEREVHRRKVDCRRSRALFSFFATVKRPDLEYDPYATAPSARARPPCAVGSASRCSFRRTSDGPRNQLPGRAKAPVRTNISFSVVTPAVIGHASHTPSPAPGDESQLAPSAAPLHAAPTFPATHATGLHVVRSGIVERRVTSRRSGEPSSLSP